MPKQKSPTIKPLGDCALVVSFDTQLSEEANISAIGFAQHLEGQQLSGLQEVVPSLVSVLVRFDPLKVSFNRFAAQIRLAWSCFDIECAGNSKSHKVRVNFGGEAGPDFREVCKTLKLSQSEFIARHNAQPMRVLAIGFAPGFIYSGMHNEKLHVARRQTVRSSVPAGSVLFAAGQTAIAATNIPTGWHVIGQTELRNFNPEAKLPVKIVAGDLLEFCEVGQ